MNRNDRFLKFVSPHTRFLTLEEDLKLECGTRLKETRLAYRTWGTLDEERRNAVLVCHALTGSADADQWWAPLFGSALDERKDYIICANLLGSCYGTTGPASSNSQTGLIYGPDFPPITLRDMAAAQKALLDRLGVMSVKIAIGGSLGGMLALELALCYPETFRGVVSIAACGRHSPWCIGQSEAQRAAIKADAKWQGGRYDEDNPPAAGLAAARMAAMCSYRSPQSFAQRHGRRLQGESPQFSVQSYLRYQGDKLVERFDANCYLTLTEAMDSHDVGRGRGDYEDVLKRLNLPALIAGYDSDVLYPINEQEELARLMPNARMARLSSLHGHDSFLIDPTDLIECVKTYIEDEKGKLE